jgi:hypothetical protein
LAWLARVPLKVMVKLLRQAGAAIKVPMPQGQSAVKLVMMTSVELHPAHPANPLELVAMVLYPDTGRKSAPITAQENHVSPR